ncbi:MAG: outer membrane protein assembly factor BamA [Desulfuromonadaceae bacterium]
MQQRILVLFVLFFLAAVNLGAETLTFDTVRIDGVKRIDKAVVEEAVRAISGTPVSKAAIDSDIRSIYSLGYFRDIEARIERDGDLMTLVYEVDERPLVRKIRTVGNEELKSSKIRGVIALRIPGILRARDLKESENAIRAMYKEEGFYAVEVSSRVEVSQSNEATVYFDITEGKKVTIDDIEFEGNTVFSDRKLRGFIQTKEWWIFSWITSGGKYNEGMLQNDLMIIKDQYFNVGHVRVDVKQPHIVLSEDRTEMDIFVEIDEGPQYNVGSVDIKGDLLLDKEEMLDQLDFTPGEVFSREKMRKNMDRLDSLYSNRGYAYVNVVPQTLIDDEKKEVNLTFKIEQGIQVEIGRINISGNTKTRDKVIRREMTLVEGDLFSSGRLESSKKRVNNLGFFSEVNVDSIPREDDESTMDVDVDVKEQPTGNFSIGFGYSSTDGFIGQGSVSQDNFLGKALQLNLSGSLGGDYTNYRIGLLNPYFMDKNLALGFDAYRTDREWDEYTVESTGGNLKLGLPLSYENRLFFVYKLEQQEIYDVNPWSSRYIRDQEGESTISSLYASISRNTTDFRPDPSRGYMSELSVEFAGIGGTEKFVKTSVDHRHFFPIKWGIVFSPHAQIGYVTDYGDEGIPLDERFFLGGINTIRGFETREVGPREPTEYPKIDENGVYVTDESGNIVRVPSTTDFDYIGGEKIAYANLELIFPLLKEAQLKGLLFFDIGNAWDEDEEYFSDMRYSAGVGIRWQSPLGPLRLEWGYNLDPYEYEDDSVFDFSIGKFF